MLNHQQNKKTISKSNAGHKQNWLLLVRNWVDSMPNLS